MPPSGRRGGRRPAKPAAGGRPHHRPPPPLRAERAALLAPGGPRGVEFCRAYAAVADRWLASLLGDQPGMALVAVGGYGRGELCPGSDLDVVLVHRGGDRALVQAAAERIWYPVWDAGVALDHSVRTVKEALAVAAGNLEAALGLLEARLVAGEADLAADLTERARRQWVKGAARWLPDLVEAVEKRHGRFGEVAFLLEPELKEGKGGLRDVHALRAAALATPVVDAGGAPVDDAYDVLLRTRVELHRLTGKALDRLLLQEQDAVADALGFTDADALMAAVAAAARTVAWAGDDGWRRVASARSGPRGRSTGRDRPLGPGLVLRDGEVALVAGADPAADPSLALRAAAAAVQAGVLLARSALDRMAADTPPMPEPWPPAALSALVALLGSGHDALPLLEALDQRGLLVRAVPEWAAVRSLPQRNAYHRFTVDRHLWETAANAAALTRRVARPDLLLLGALLHDIGKGFPGDHTDAGVEVVGRLGPRLGLPPDDVAVLEGMVRHHLLLPDVATRRNLDDPATVESVAAAVGDRDRLELLAALTEADSLATGPSAWGSWKAGLVQELVARTATVLAGHRPPAVPALPTPAHRAVMAGRRLVVDAQGSEVTVVAPDQPGLLAVVAGTLALHRLDVRSASVGGEDGMAVEVFDVEPAFGQAPDWPAVAADVERALAGRLPIEARLAERARAYAGRGRPAAARQPEPRVLFDDEASAAATVVEVRAPDGIGVLYRITRALADCGLDVRSAKVATLGHEVVDAFYVTDVGGAKLAGDDRRRSVEEAVLAVLAGVA
ncbi:MAG TPA: [protein-PII] uridylyltransferase [Acidimicrobiales bacterium]|nr:[protein-PII] uridylyltransferase [Acidimicrobiales bacterium]